MPHAAIRAVDALGGICGNEPTLARVTLAREGLELHGWNTGAVEEVHIPENDELIVSLHLAGARHVRLFTDNGLSRSVSKPGDITVMPRGKPISFQTRGAVEFVTLHLAPRAKTGHHRDERTRIMSQSDCLFAFRDDYILASIKAMIGANAVREVSQAKYCSTLLDSLIVHLATIIDRHDAERIELPSTDNGQARNAKFDLVLNYIDKKLAEKLSLEDLADCAGMSRAVFARAFSERFRCSPHRFLIQRRIDRAKKLLANGSLSCADIAYEVGFSGQSHFSTVFKAVEGVSPHAFANAARVRVGDFEGRDPDQTESR